MTDKTSAVLIKMCQIIYEQLPSGYRFACAIIDEQGQFSTACSPGLQNTQAGEMFATIDAQGTGETVVIHKRN